MRNALIVAGVVLGLALGFLAFIYFFRDPAEMPPVEEILGSPEYGVHETGQFPEGADGMEATEPVGGSAGAETDWGPLPSLDESDAYLERLAEEESVAGFGLFKAKHRLRRLATAILLINEGKNPGSQLGFLQPTAPFLVEERDGEIWLSQRNYARYDALVKAVTDVDAGLAARLYRHVEPLVDAAYRELGVGDDWGAAWRTAAERILAVEVPAEPVRLQGGPLVFIFAEQSDEDRPMLEKAFLRMGPHHTRAVQEWLGSFIARVEAVSPQ